MHSRSFLLLLCLSFASHASADDAGLNVGVELGKTKSDWDFSGSIRETRLTRFGIFWNEPLTASIYGGVELGHLEITQYSNPIPAGQTGGGEYIGINLSFLILNTRSFELLSRIAYRYNDARHSIDDQTVEWDWHEGQLGLYSRLKFTDTFSLSAGVSARAIDGRETATGPVSEAQPFRADGSSISGHLGAQLTLDDAGTIGIEIDTGSVRGGRLSFERVF